MDTSSGAWGEPQGYLSSKPRVNQAKEQQGTNQGKKQKHILSFCISGSSPGQEWP
jgi:hypothetical protein